jgi:hypothetical protein
MDFYFDFGKNDAGFKLYVKKDVKNCGCFQKTGMVVVRYGGAALWGRQTTVPERQCSPEEMKIHLCSYCFFSENREK